MAGGAQPGRFGRRGQRPEESTVSWTVEPGAVPLLDHVMVRGERTAAGHRSLADAHARFLERWAEVPPGGRELRGAGRHPVAPARAR